MWQIIKSLFRYSWKNCVSFIMLFVLLSVSSGVFSTLMMLSSNLSNSYNSLVKKGNLNNVVINELYSSTYEGTNEDGQPISLSGEEAKVQNKIEFKKELANLIGEDSFRDFVSINFTNSSTGFVYKIIGANNDVTIDKTVIYSGRNVLTQTFDFDKLIQDANWNLDGLINKQARRLAAFLASKAKWTNEGYGQQFKIDAKSYLQITDENNNLYDPKNWPLKDTYTNSQGQTETKTTLAGWMNVWFDANSTSYTQPISKGYRLSLDVSGIAPVVGRIDNLSSYTAVVPNYVLEKQKKSIAPKSIIDKLEQYNTMPMKTSNQSTIYDYDYSSFATDYINQSELETYIKSIDSKYKVKVDNIEYIIVGEGISPSFMYPVYSFERQTPNIDNEILIYANYSGWQLSYDSARSSPLEAYIEAKVPDNELNFYINKINEISKKYMSWTNNIRAAYSIYDESNLLAPNALRVSFLPSLVESQVVISNSLMLFISILIAMIFVFTIKKYINDNRSSLGALRANGIKKRWIVWCIPILSLLPAVGGGLVGYLFSQFSQQLFINLYSFYWTIPTPLTLFNPLLFLGLTFLPFIVMAVISIFATYILLKGDTNKLLNESNRFKSSWFSMKASSIFPKASIITKFRTSIAFSSISKLLMISVMFALLGISSTVGISLSNKFSDVRKLTFDNKEYNYAVDLITPTIQNGMYFRQQPDFPGRLVIDDKNSVLNFNIGAVDSNYKNFRQQQGNGLLYSNDSLSNSYLRIRSSSDENVVGSGLLVQIPSVSDSGWQTSDLAYLNNRFMTPSVMDVEVGLGSLKANPWDIARNLAPMNQITISNNLTKALWTEILFDTNIYFNEKNLTGLVSSADIKRMANKPLCEIFTYDKDYNPNGYGYIKQYYPYNQFDNNKPNDQLLEPNENTIEVYNQYGDIIEQYLMDKSAINKVTYLDHPFVIAISTILNLHSREYAFNYDSMTEEQKEKAKAYIEQVNKYRTLFFKGYYNYVPMEDSDETYTNVQVESPSIPSSFYLKGIKPDSKMIKLVNLNGNVINDKLKLQTIDESKYDHTNIHSLYADSSLSHESNFNVIINESAAFQYNLKVGDTIEVDPTNETTRYNVFKDEQKKKKYDELNSRKFTFKVIDIISTYQNPEFYINQRIANYINCMTEPEIIQTSFYNHYDKVYVHDEESWFDYNSTFTIQQIDPFNGFFTTSINPEIVSSLSVYSESGIAPANDKIFVGTFYDKLINNVMKSTKTDLNKVASQNTYISKIKLSRALGYNSVEELDVYWNSLPDDGTRTSVIINDFVTIYGQSPLLSSAYFIEAKSSFYTLFTEISSFVNLIFVFVLVIIIVISLLSVFYLTIDFIYSSISLCGMLKAFGFKDSSNVLSFLSIFFPSIIIATAISIPITMFALQLIKKFLFGFSGILLPLTYWWWYFLAVLGILFVILAITICVVVYILKKQEITKLIARY